MSHVFTDYVRALDPEGAPPDAGTFDALRRALRRKLVRELKKRGIWGSPPSYLGIYGATSWSEPATAGAGPDPLDELFAACYEFIFIRRLRNLLVHLRAKPSIDGLVVLNLRHFLFETQKKHDPLGFRIFKLVQAAARAAIAAGELDVLAGDSRIRNDTILGPPAAAGGPVVAGPRLEEIVKPWNDALLPELITARGKAQQRVIDALSALVRRLAEDGVERFRFKDLVDPLKNDARQRWANRLAEEDLAVGSDGEEVPELDMLLRPDLAVEERESFLKLVDCVTAAVDRSPATAATRRYLSALWEFLRAWVAERDDDLPSRRQLAERLGIPRNRMTELFATLGELLRACREASLANASVNLGRGASKSEGMAMSQRSTEPEALRRRTGQARRRHADTERELDRRAGEAPRPGDLFIVAATARLPVEWAILEAAAGGRFVAVPADASPFAGGADAVVPETSEHAPLTLRCAFAVELAAADLDPTLRTGDLPVEVVERAREQRHEHAGVAVSDADSMEYRDWAAEVLEPARARVAGDRVAADRVAADRVAADRVVAFRRRSRRFSIRPYAVAASILLAAGLGFGGGLMWRTGPPPVPAQPLVDVPFRAIFPAAASRGEPQTVTVPSAADFLLLIVNVTEVETLDAYRLEIEPADGAGEPIWSGELKRSGQSLTVTWPTAWPAGDYRLRLYGLPDGPDQPLAEYRLRIGYDGP